VAALRAQNMVGIPLSGQDGDVAALNRVAKGEQTVTVWKDARALGHAAGNYAAQMASGTRLAEVKDAHAWSGGSKKIAIPSIFLKPIAVTRDNLKVVIDADWASKEQVCVGVAPAKAPPACK
jgi:D-xylose transport system substrate-binding protein